MKNAYLAICYICNEFCTYCPCGTGKRDKDSITTFDALKEKIDFMKEDGVDHITISGGEPTIHPDFSEIVKYICSAGMNVTILSNGEHFSDDDLFQKITDEWDHKMVRVITTIHSQDCKKHEEANRKKGSFNRTIAGLKRIEGLGIKVIIKHCITRENFRELVPFYKFICDEFSEETDIQLCSIDYVGIPSERLQDERLTFPEIRPYLEAVFDCDIASLSNRKLYCINIPLCSCDPYYWKYIPVRRSKMYDAYSDPTRSAVVNVDDNVATDERYCGDCAVKSICNGAYKTAFTNYGAPMVKPYNKESD